MRTLIDNELLENVNGGLEPTSADEKMMCTNYPNCTYTQPAILIGFNTTDICPWCGGKLILQTAWALEQIYNDLENEISDPTNWNWGN